MWTLSFLICYMFYFVEQNTHKGNGTLASLGNLEVRKFIIWSVMQCEDFHCSLFTLPQLVLCSYPEIA